MSVQFKDEEICVGDECRYLPKNGPIKFMPYIRYDKISLIRYAVIFVCLILLILLMGKVIIKVNRRSISRIAMGDSVISSSGYGGIGSMGMGRVNVTTL